jgi:hypothetical protein
MSDFEDIKRDDLKEQVNTVFDQVKALRDRLKPKTTEDKIKKLQREVGTLKSQAMYNDIMREDIEQFVLFLITFMFVIFLVVTVIAATRRRRTVFPPTVMRPPVIHPVHPGFSMLA